ncbi:MAG: serine/threonine protein kinase [Myxococcales bacterium]|nr:serine/threonine protein kinase [Myxococcales bacterium]
MQNSPARSSIDVGSVIADTYTIEGLLGRGGMGAVFVASHKRLPGKKVAIKMLHADISSDEVLARFKREAEIASRLGHPNIVEVHDFNVLPDGTPYLVLELLEGATLAQRLREGPIPVEQVMTIVRQIGSALAAAHREGIVHRDLKPQNIFLVPTEVQGQVVEIAKVLDFGISKIRGSQTVKTQDSALLGTPQYMAPEQALGQHANVDDRTDVFALGAIVYEMLSGQPAFIGASIPEVVFKVVYEQPIPIEQAVPGLAPRIKSAIERAMAKVAADRFGSVSEFVEAMTGQPLAIIRSGSNSMPPDSSSGRARSGGSEALAQTMDSGDHGRSPISGVEATAASIKSVVGGTSAPAGASPPVSSSGATLDSQNQPAAGPAQPSVVVAAASPARSKTLLAFGLIAGASLAALAMYFVMRKPAEPKPVAIAETAPAETKPAETKPAETKLAETKPAQTKLAETKPAETKPAETTPAETKPAETKPAETKPAETKPAETKPAETKLAETHAPDIKTSEVRSASPKPDPKRANTKLVVTPPITSAENEAADTDSKPDETSAQKLQQAESVLTSNPALAEQLANSVINSQTSGPIQRLHAHAIRGVLKCTQHNDAEGAIIDLRPIRESRGKAATKFARRIMANCRKAGFTIDQ